MHIHKVAYSTAAYSRGSARLAALINMPSFSDSLRLPLLVLCVLHGGVIGSGHVLQQQLPHAAPVPTVPPSHPRLATALSTSECTQTSTVGLQHHTILGFPMFLQPQQQQQSKTGEEGIDTESRRMQT